MRNELPAIGSPTRTLAILNRYHLTAKKSLGQNFLTDVNVLERIVDAADVQSDDNVIEIGPGIGSLTEQIAKRAKQVVAFEIDQNLLPVLDDTLAPYDNVTIVNEDILQANLPEVIQKEFGSTEHLKVVANLPYYITTPIIMNLLNEPVNFESIVVMMQKEVAERLSAKPSTKAYSSLSVIIQYLHNVQTAFNVSHKLFIPAPKVDSAIVVLTPRANDFRPVFDDHLFMGFVKGCFLHRRKTFWNNLQGFFDKKPATKEKIQTVLDRLSIKPGIRPEKLTVDDFVELANQFHLEHML